MNVAIIGSNGQLGSDVVRAFVESGDHVCSLTHADIEITDTVSIRNVLGEIKPDIVVNTAAMHHVDRCEADPDKAEAINTAGPCNLASAAGDLDFVLMHISTDYVFDGQKEIPYNEDDIPRPLNVYGRTKAAGEQCIQNSKCKYFILRTSALYGRSPCREKGGLNFVQLMLKLARDRGEVRVVDSEIVTPTSTEQLAKQVVALSRTDSYGLYHATSEGSCSWYQFARTIFWITNSTVNLKIAGPEDFANKTPRPKYSVLENRGLKCQGLNVFGSWEDGLRDYLRAAAL